MHVPRSETGIGDKANRKRPLSASCEIIQAHRPLPIITCLTVLPDSLSSISSVCHRSLSSRTFRTGAQRKLFSGELNMTKTNCYDFRQPRSVAGWLCVPHKSHNRTIMGSARKLAFHKNYAAEITFSPELRKNYFSTNATHDSGLAAHHTQTYLTKIYRTR